MAFSKSRRLGDLVTNTDGDLTSAGDVGLGTSSPNERLEVAGNLTLTPSSPDNSPSSGATISDINFVGRTDNAIVGKIRAIHNDNNNGTDGQLLFYTADNTASAVASEKMRIDSTGKVGIGIAPDEMLHLFDGGTDTKIKVQSKVAADATASILLMSRTADNTNKNLTLQAYRGNLSITGDSGYGNVGIGTSSPGGKFHVEIDNDSGGIFADANLGLLLKNNSTTDNSAVTIGFQTNQGTGAMLQTVFPNADTNRHGELYVSTSNSSGGLAERARFTHEGIRFPNGMGIDFQNTATGINSSNSTSALFDDYEEGTWTPTFAGVACPSIYSAHYVKIGQLVMVESYLAGDTQNNSNQFRIAGLPYTSKNQTAYGGGSIGFTYTTDYREFGAPIVPGNTSYIYFHRIDGASGAYSVVNSYVYNKANANQLFLFQAFYRAD